MKRTNTVADALNTGEADLDLGDGLSTRLPLGRAYTIDQTAGRVVKIWDYLNNREQIIYGDTGDRDVTSLVSIPTTAGTVHVTRAGQMVSLHIYNLQFPTAGGTTALVLPSGFRPSRSIPFAVAGISLNGQVTQYGNVQMYNWTANGPIFGSVSFRTPDPWPTSLPGTAV